MADKVLWEQTSEPCVVTLAIVVYKCGQCDHTERAQEGGTSDYARRQIEAHYVAQHMPKKKLKARSEFGWRERVLYYVTGQCEFNALMAYAKRGSQYAIEAEGKFTKPGWYIDVEGSRRDSEDGTVITHHLWHTAEWADVLECEAADKLGLARDVRALMASAPT